MLFIVYHLQHDISLVQLSIAIVIWRTQISVVL